MTIYWCYKFWLDEDLTLVDYKHYDMSANIEYPMLSLCFLNPLNGTAIESYNATFTERMYLNYLKGIEFQKGMELIDHENVVIKLEDFYHGHFVMFKNGTEIEELNLGNESNLPEVTFSGFLVWRIYPMSWPKNKK